MRIVDTHLHLVYLDRFSYPWLADAPALNRRYELEDYRQEAKRLGIEGALHMEVDVAEADIENETRFVAALPEPIIGSISACRPESENFEPQFERVLAVRRVKGFRRILHTSPDELSESETFMRNVRRIGKAGRTFDVCVLARQLPVARRLIERCPDTQFILDHCGVPDVAARALDPWREGIARVAALPNVAVKLSGIVAYAGADWTVDDLLPFARHVIETFGPDRVVWGSDAPVCTLTANLTRWVEATHELIADYSAAERSAILADNAIRIYGI